VNGVAAAENQDPTGWGLSGAVLRAAEKQTFARPREKIKWREPAIQLNSSAWRPSKCAMSTTLQLCVKLVSRLFVCILFVLLEQVSTAMQCNAASQQKHSDSFILFVK
jgi:hypothetical protein